MDRAALEVLDTRPPTKPSEDLTGALLDGKSITTALIEAVPNGVFSEYKTARLFETEPAIRHDATTGSWCWVHVDVAHRFSEAVFLLPLSLPAASHLRSLRDALIAAGDAVPDALAWEVRARFESERRQEATLRVATWSLYFADAKTESNDAGTVARIWLPTLAEAIVTAREWKL